MRGVATNFTKRKSVWTGDSWGRRDSRTETRFTNEENLSPFSYDQIGEGILLRDSFECPSLGRGRLRTRLVSLRGRGPIKCIFKCYLLQEPARTFV